MSADIESPDAAPAAVFISYRRAEAAGWARALYERLAAEFGRANVFFDQASIPPGMNWPEKLHGECTGCTALIALIGPQWIRTVKGHYDNREDDYVGEEIKRALKSGDQKVIPVLIEDAQVPGKEDLPRLPWLVQMFENQTPKLSASSGWDADVENLIARLRQMGVPAAPEASPPSSPQAAPAPEPDAPTQPASEPPTPKPSPVVQPVPTSLPPAEPVAPAAATASAVDPPPTPHYAKLANLMVKRVFGVVPFLGPGVNSCGRAERWEGDDSEYIPDSDELAAYLADLAEQMGIGGARVKEAIPSLAFASQDLAIKENPNFLYEKLRDALIKEQVLPSDPSSGAVHRFLANLPKRLRDLQAPASCQLIVTTNYDNALEQAFEKAREPFDVAVYVPSKETFLHIPYEGEPQEVRNPNQEPCFPVVAREWRPERTVIMKIHGTIDPSDGSGESKDYCVLTEDDYIDYMKGPIESIVPFQLLNRLKASRLLFLGHELDDWSLRVFLLRVFGGSALSDTASWALQRNPSEFDQRFWGKMGVEHFGIPLDKYVEELEKHFPQPAAADQSQT